MKRVPALVTAALVAGLSLNVVRSAHAEEPAASTGPASAAAPADGAAFNRELLSVEEKVDDLKERVFRSKAALMYLNEVVSTGSTGAGSRFTISLRNSLGAGHVLEGVTFLLDGQIKFAGNDASVDKALRAGSGLEVFSGALSPSTHDVTATYRIRSTGYKIFSYAQGDTYEIRVRNTFQAEMGNACTLTANLSEGSAVKTFEKRAKVEFKVSNCARVNDAGTR